MLLPILRLEALPKTFVDGLIILTLCLRKCGGVLRIYIDICRSQFAEKQGFVLFGRTVLFQEPPCSLKMQRRFAFDLVRCISQHWRKKPTDAQNKCDDNA